MRLIIGSVALDNNLILASVAGVTNLPFRSLCKEQGYGLMYTKMVSAKAIYYKNKSAVLLLEVWEEKRLIAMRLFGSGPVIMSKMTKQVEDGPYDIIDIDMGCPILRVMNNGGGSALVKNPKLMEEILTAMMKVLKKPVAVKSRRGSDETCINAVEVVKIAKSYGVAAVAVHGGTGEQYYSGKVGWEIIQQVKKTVKTPVTGNGNTLTPRDTKRTLGETGCDGLVIAREVRGNPQISREINHYPDTGKLLLRPGKEGIREMLLCYASLQVEYKDEYLEVRETRKHMA